MYPLKMLLLELPEPFCFTMIEALWFPLWFVSAPAPAVSQHTLRITQTEAHFLHFLMQGAFKERSTGGGRRGV